MKLEEQKKKKMWIYKLEKMSKNKKELKRFKEEKSEQKQLQAKFNDQKMLEEQETQTMGRKI